MQTKRKPEPFLPLLTASDPVEDRRLLRAILEQDFRQFVRYCFYILNRVPWANNWHHDEITDALLKCHRHETQRLLINIPPRYSKTELAVVMFIAWSLAKNPRAQFIHLSYSDELALDNSARVKELILTEEFQALWPIRLSPDRQAKGLWRTVDGGGLKAGAAGGAVTGFGAGVTDDEFGGAIIIDDPLKPDDAESETERTKVNRRLNGTIKSRLNAKKAPIICIMQRIHDDDVSGFVLNGGTGEPWEHLSIPVMDKKGTPLWNFRHTEKELAAIRMADKYVWNGQYMQEPIPDEGEFFHADQARWYTNLPKHLNFYCTGDFAVSEGRGDYTELAVWGVCPAGNVYAVDWWSGQTKSDRWIEELLDLCYRWNVELFAGETGPIKSAIEPFLTKRMRERGQLIPTEWISHSSANYKVANARSFQALWEQGRVYLPKGSAWANDLLLQLTRFPLGKLDDKVDASSIFARTITKVWEQIPPKPETTDIPLPKDGEVVLMDLMPRNEPDWYA